eukprot:497839_1
MSHKQISTHIENILKEESTTLDAINSLRNELPFVNEETLYKMIIDILKHNKHLSLTDNFQSDSSDIDNINEETEDLMELFQDNEVIQLRKTLMSHDEKNNDIETNENKNTNTLPLS